MGRANCEKCGEVRWYAHKGAKLSETPCPRCGGPLTGLTAGRPGANKGRKAEVCVVCGEKRFNLLHPQEPFKRKISSFDITYPAKRPCCSWHDPISLDYVNPLDLEPNTPEWQKAIDRQREFRKAAGAANP